jgi:hypothetical protein
MTTNSTAMRGTADLCDDHGDHVQVCEPVFHLYGGRRAFHGPISTVFCFEDNSRVKEAVESPGLGQGTTFSVVLPVRALQPTPRRILFDPVGLGRS